jgi:Recombination endonuclease VII
MEPMRATRKQMTATERQQIASLYLTGIKVAEISALTRRSIYSIYSALAREGIERRRSSEEAPQIPCEVCGTGFHSPKKTARFCSQACKAKSETVMRQCERCGTDFRPHRKTTRFCSRACIAEPRPLRACASCGNLYKVPRETPARLARYGPSKYCSNRCRADAQRVEVKAPPDLYARRRWQLWTVYRITPDDYEEMYQRQQGRCAICGVPKERWEPAPVKDRPRFLVVDHNHSSKEVRGLLCTQCNIGVGQFKENPAIMYAAAAYLASQETRVAAQGQNPPAFPWEASAVTSE